MILPKFNGWRALDGSEVTRNGDVFVRVSFHGMDKRTPETGNRLYCSSIGKNARDWEGTSWWVYRRADAKTIPRRIAMNRGYSQPLPLP